MIRTGSPAPKAGSSRDSSAPETSYQSGENGHKIAFDPRDISESAERSKQPKLTLMEEVLLLGLKDKQVSAPIYRSCFSRLSTWHCACCLDYLSNHLLLGIPIILERQYLICAARMYRHRAGVPGAREHAKGSWPAAIPSGRPSDRGD